jgi:hypothetical protein
VHYLKELGPLIALKEFYFILVIVSPKEREIVREGEP